MTFNWLSDISPALKAQELWQEGTYQREGLFHLVYRPHRPFAISCGAGLLAEHIRQFRFSPDVITRMGQMMHERGHNIFSESFLNHLQRLKLRVNLWAPPEGMLLLPGEPLLIARGPIEQVYLMESAFRFLVWRSSQWATRIATERWETGDWTEEDTPVAPPTSIDFDGWKIRASYIGGALADHIIETVKEPSRPIEENEGLIPIWESGVGQIGDTLPLTQIRRLYRSQEAVGDVWLTEELEEKASVSRTSIRLTDVRTEEEALLRFSRFQNLYQPVLVKGHPVLSNTRISYLRQRTLKQLEAFHHQKLDEYPRGWAV